MQYLKFREEFSSEKCTTNLTYIKTKTKGILRL